jgi:hypothetical protein
MFGTSVSDTIGNIQGLLWVASIIFDFENEFLPIDATGLVDVVNRLPRTACGLLTADRNRSGDRCC